MEKEEIEKRIKLTILGIQIEEKMIEKKKEKIKRKHINI